MTERVLIVAAHPDDEVLGCGGTIARHVAEGDDVHLLFVADGETARGMKARPNRNFMAYEAAKLLGAKPPVFLDFSDQRLDQLALLDITKLIELHALSVIPTIVYTHHAGDLNLDHQIVNRAVMTAFRPLPGSAVKAIYAFEVLSSTEWGCGFVPNHFVDIDVMAGEKTARGKKFEALQCYDTEMRRRPHARCYDAVTALMESRGFACGVHAAEAFMTMRSIVR
jgi:LmbE family N-acetylglucosaminyl deacetylase